MAVPVIEATGLYHIYRETEVETVALRGAERARRRRRVIGLVLQRDNLHPLLDAAGNVSLPLRLDGRPSAEIAARVAELLPAVGLADRTHHDPSQLSGGEVQRTAIALAMAPRPRVLLCDEPTGELDEATAAGILDLLDTLRSQEGTALLTVTHNDRVTERADRRLTMRDGVVTDD